MEVYKRMMLTYIKKYGKIDFDILSSELRIPINSLVEIVDDLLVKEYIKSVNREIMLTDKGLAETYSTWNGIVLNEEESIELQFQWDELYIPEKFLEKL